MNLKKNYEYYLLFIISLIYFTFLYYRNSNLFPSVMGDEFVHSTYARHYKFQEMQIPTYLYYWIFSLTKYYSVEYFNCARIINSFFFLLGNLLIYLMSKKYLSTWQSILLFSLVLFSP